MRKMWVGIVFAVVLLLSANLMAQVVVIPDGTPVRLRLAETLQCENSHEGDNVAFEVTDDVKIDGVTVIPHGALAYGHILDGTHWAKRVGRGGKVYLDFNSVTDVTGRQVPILTQERYKQARGRGSELTVAMVSYPTPLWLLALGKKTKFPEGQRFLVVTKGDKDVDLRKLAMNTATPNSVTPASTSMPSTSAPLQQVASAHQQQLAYSRPASVYTLTSRGVIPSR